MNIEMIIISFIAAGVSALIMLFPVIPRSKNTVVENKSKRHLSGTPFWEKYFIDIILLGISIYLLYGYYKQQDSLRLTVVSGSGIDPMIFLDSKFYTEEIPVYPFMKDLCDRGKYKQINLFLTDDPEEVCEIVNNRS